MIERLAHRKDHAVAFEALHFIGGNRAAAAGFVVLAEPRLDHLDGLHVAVCVAQDAVRRGQKDEAHALLLGRLDLLVDGGHVLALAAVEDGDLRAHAQHGARRIDGRIAAADDGDPRSRRQRFSLLATDSRNGSAG